MEITFTIASIALPVAGLFFWGRGVLKSRKSDIILGFSVLALFCLAAVAGSGSSSIFSELGMVALAFGLETLVLSAFAKPDCPINRKERIAVGVGAIVAGALSSMIL
jgi:hypothetical protein